MEAEPLLEAYWWWVNTLEPTPGSKLAEAVTYARNQKGYLNAFLEHGEVDISNNYAENAIRPFTVGRKNWLFCDTPKGADASAIVYTLAETAKANGLEPYRYRAIQEGTHGVDMGRNIFQSDCPAGMAQAIGKVVHEGYTATQAHEVYEEVKNRN